MNAGSHGHMISNHLISIEILDPDGRLHTMEKSSLNFGYRMSSIPHNYIILGATFRFIGCNKSNRQPISPNIQIITM
jgi:UDP-N-acetylmuramate dehydrogenase